MLFCDSATLNDAGLDSLAIFVSQARGMHLPAVICEDVIEGISLSEAQSFDLGPFLTTLRPGPDDTLVMLGAENITTPTMQRIARNGSPGNCLAFGNFETAQSRIGTAAKLSYALGLEPEIICTTEQSDITLLASADIPIFGVPSKRRRAPRPRVLLVHPNMATPQDRSALSDLSRRRDFDIEILTTGSQKETWTQEQGFDVPAWHLGELLPRSLAARFDMAVCFDKPIGWSRYLALLANLAASQAILIDATPSGSFADFGGAFISGPTAPADLAAWLRSDILANSDAVRQSTQDTALSHALHMPQALIRAGAKSADAPTEVSRSKLLFMPTNGVGLGHAKRCSVIAQALQRPGDASFAAFPSCLGMLTGAGFDTTPLVSRTPHRPAQANDLLNHLRLQASAAHSKGFVFDGGYIFSSVVRAIADHDLPAVWIRRGLWQKGPSERVALDRQKLFDRIVVPREAFDELNAPTPPREDVTDVGPVVQQIDLAPSEIAQAREAVVAAIGGQPSQIVVTMLGGGVAADRRAQTAAVCAHLSAKPDVLNLVVAYPTATIDPLWAAFPNTNIIRTRHASALIQIADLLVSAVGYNSFHEVLYGAVPTIFVPQMASFMDDQRARAQAAEERGVALLVEPWETLRLTQAIDECLEGRAKDLQSGLRALNLPEPGAPAAARIIEEICA